MNGIDVLGGMMVGFHKNGQKNSKERSVNFMVDCLSLDKDVATMLYEEYRCGLVHEGISTGRTIFYLQTLCDSNTFLFLSENKEAVLLNVSELARQYLKAVAEISKDISKLHYISEKKTNGTFNKGRDKIKGTWAEFEYSRTQSGDAVGSGGTAVEEWLAKQPLGSAIDSNFLNFPPGRSI
jgi:hypothetical protein